jgi:hypothetical protein
MQIGGSERVYLAVYRLIRVPSIVGVHGTRAAWLAYLYKPRRAQKRSMPQRVHDRSGGWPRARGARSCSLWPAESRMSVPGCDSMGHRNGLPSLYSAGGVRFDLKRVTVMPSSRVAATTSARRHAGPAPTRRPWPRPQRQRWQACSKPLTIRTSVRASPWFRGCAQCRCPARDALTCRCG